MRGSDKFVVLDAHYQPSIQKLLLAGFQRTVPRRCLAPEIMNILPDPGKVLRDWNAEYAKLDAATTTFDYPVHHDDPSVQLVLTPASYAHLSVPPSLAPNDTASETRLDGYDIYKNVCYPLERVLLESFIRVVLADGDMTGMNRWAMAVSVWVSTMSGYLEVDNDAVDDCPDDAVREWYSVHFGRKHEAKFGPWDRRIMKRLGSGREMPVDMRGHPVALREHDARTMVREGERIGVAGKTPVSAPSQARG
ncbi:MAG: hypothetical protein M1826_007537 [Phylliscum demangeonii]|nr:MAG: hypothetical protein M1826_007537 [Phylliscum demangeonii]